MPRHAKYRYPKGAKLNGKSVGGRYATPAQLEAYSRRQRRRYREHEEDLMDVESVEWEIAVDYNTSGYSNSKSKGVDVNVRLRRVDRQQMSFEEAYDAWSVLQYAHELPPDYEVAVIDWRRPEGSDTEFSTASTRTARGQDALTNLLPPLVNAPDVSVQLHQGELRDEPEWRFGAVEEG